MEETAPRTEFVRRLIEGRRHAPDAAYAHDLLELERLAALPFRGMVGSMALANLTSRYPKEADAILRELGIRPLVPLEDERVRALLAERLRLAEARHPLGRLRPEEPAGLFES